MGGGQGAVSGEVQSVEIEFGRFVSKYQCWGEVRIRIGRGTVFFPQVRERFRKSIIPKHSEIVSLQKMI